MLGLTGFQNRGWGLGFGVWEDKVSRLQKVHDYSHFLSYVVMSGLKLSTGAGTGSSRACIFRFQREVFRLRSRT